MLVPKELESKIMAAITTATSSLAASPTISGSWQPTSAGLVRWIESGDGVSTVNVAVGTASHGTFTAPTVSFAANVSLFVRCDLDPTGSVLAATSEALENLFRTWQSSTYQQAFTALDVSEFAVGDISIQGGNSPEVSPDRGIVSVRWPLTISGCYLIASEPSSAPSGQEPETAPQTNNP